MEKFLLKDIEKQARELCEKYNTYHNFLHLTIERKNKIYIVPTLKKVHVPKEWKRDRKHNPFYVYKRKEQIAKSVSKKILDGTYLPNPPFLKEIPKPNGGKRKISIYQIQDSAVSDRFYHNLLSKNKHRFSSLTYAYRNDRNIHYAIQDIANELKHVPRIFVAEFDFSDFFGSINHEYLFSQLNQNAFLWSDRDMQIMKAFLADREKGIPLGTSISLFLANVVCWKLDRSLEDQGVRFARYADDTIIWSKDYSKITKAFDIINSFSEDAGIRINYKKSDGISLLQSKDMKSEFLNTKEHIEFLGYKISAQNISIKDQSIRKIKKQITYLLYKNLLQPLKPTRVHPQNFPQNDKDKNFLSAISEIRRYLYGNLTESLMRRYLNGTYKILRFKGIMSFYPLINDIEQLQYLDKWLVCTIMNVLNRRERELSTLNPSWPSNQSPFNLDKDSLIFTYKKTILEIPSFLRIHNAIQKGLKDDGIDRVMNPQSGYYE
ncbi:reverse transcriptase domain-containing protein [Flavobacterium silvaticum]|uniref:RNA-dependent DNA polymerase n=1 Tax=Flavobacterium silvaticum TaxID=1852020 RepID=A0A972JGX4_9FLAO|nr:reverse transcriptase domain-containing protein [Flavobacterium silvaticum]NMH26518.1 RNA-dependent DNA polymerase [Flavobacterium silvaticum]